MSSKNEVTGQELYVLQWTEEEGGRFNYIFCAENTLDAKIAKLRQQQVHLIRVFKCIRQMRLKHVMEYCYV